MGQVALATADLDADFRIPSEFKAMRTFRYALSPYLASKYECLFKPNPIVDRMAQLSDSITEQTQKGPIPFNLILARIVRFSLKHLYLSALLITAFIASVLNYNGRTMSGLVPAYLDFADFFRGGFDLTQGKGLTVQTFPMWGYGLIFLVTKSKTIIIALQQLVSISVLLFVDYSLGNFGWKASSRIVFRVLTILSFQWFYFHTILWLYSIGANLLVAAVFLVLNYFRFRSVKYLILASMCFGIMLNFRSDYFFFALAIPVLILIIDWIKNEKKLWLHYSLWYLVIFVCLVPWGIYSLKKTGSYLQKSSNGGHVLFISLGQLPENKWGITPLDGDPKMRKLVATAFGKGATTLSHPADKLLTGKWLGLILDDKMEFFRKCKFNVQSIYRNPFYVGELNQISEGYADVVISSKLDRRIQALADGLADNSRFFQTFMPVRILYEKMGLELPKLILVAIGLVFLFFRFQIFKEETFVLVLSVILYQYALLILAYYMRGYHTNIFILYEVLLVFLIIELNPFGGIHKKWLELLKARNVLVKS